MLKGGGSGTALLAARQMLGDFIDSLPDAPSEYGRRNVWFGVSFMRDAEVARRHQVGPDRMMWGATTPTPKAPGPIVGRPSQRPWPVFPQRRPHHSSGGTQSKSMASTAVYSIRWPRKSALRTRSY